MYASTQVFKFLGRIKLTNSCAFFGVMQLFARINFDEDSSLNEYNNFQNFWTVSTQ